MRRLEDGGLEERGGWKGGMLTINAVRKGSTMTGQEFVQIFYAGQQESFKPPSSRIELGDPRIKPYLTSYAQSYAAPLPEGKQILMHGNTERHWSVRGDF